MNMAAVQGYWTPYESFSGSSIPVICSGFLSHTQHLVWIFFWSSQCLLSIMVLLGVSIWSSFLLVYAQKGGFLLRSLSISLTAESDRFFSIISHKCSVLRWNKEKRRQFCRHTPISCSYSCMFGMVFFLSSTCGWKYWKGRNPTGQRLSTNNLTPSAQVLYIPCLLGYKHTSHNSNSRFSFMVRFTLRCHFSILTSRSLLMLVLETTLTGNTDLSIIKI